MWEVLHFLWVPAPQPWTLDNFACLSSSISLTAEFSSWTAFQIKSLYQCPTVALPNYHKLCGFKQQQVNTLWFSRRGFILSPFPVSRVFHIAWSWSLLLSSKPAMAGCLSPSPGVSWDSYLILAVVVLKPGVGLILTVNLLGTDLQQVCEEFSRLDHLRWEGPAWRLEATFHLPESWPELSRES